MALTKVSGHIIDQPFDVGIITATNQYVSGIGTFGNIRVLGDLQIDGTTTTLDTVVTEVDRLEVGANNSTVGVAITQSGTGDILNLYDGTNKEFSVEDGGTVKVSQAMAFQQSDRVTSSGLLGRGSLLIAGTQQTDFAIRSATNNSNLILGVGVTERLRITSTGSVGIGTDTISDNLEIFAPTNASLQIKGGNTGSDANRTAQLKLLASGSKLYVMEADATDGSFRILDSSTERLRVNSAGDLCLGSAVGANNDGSGISIYNSSFPRISFRNSTTGNTVADGSQLYLVSDDLYVTNNENADVIFRTNSTERLRITSAGSVGIGTDNPTNYGGAVKLALSSSGHTGLSIAAGTSSDSNIFFADGTSGDATYVGNIKYAHNDNSMRFQTAAAEKLRITSGGDIQVKTDGGRIYGSGTFTVFSGSTSGRLDLYGGSTNHGGEIQLYGGSNSDGEIVFRSGAGAGQQPERLRIDSAGKVRVPDNGKFTAGDGDDLQIYHDGGTNFIEDAGVGNLHLKTNGSEIRIEGSSASLARFYNGASVELHHNGSTKLETTTTGAKVTGALEVTQEYPSIRPTLDLNFVATKALDRRITFTRDSIGTFTDDMGIVKYASNNVPRFDHDPTTGESLGLLIEESRTNLLIYSNMTSGEGIATGYANGGTTVSKGSNATAPDGTLTAWNSVYNGTSGDAALYKAGGEITTTNNTSYTLSVFAKVPSTNTYITGVRLRTYNSNHAGGFNLLTGTVLGTAEGTTTNRIEAYPNGWYRCSITFTSGTDGNQGVQFYLINNASTALNSSSANGEELYLWGVQLEQGSFPTSYIPTNGSTVTRAVETAKITGTNFTDFYNQNEGTIVSEHSIATGVAAGDNTYVYQVDDGSDTNVEFRLIDHNGAHGDVLRAYGFTGGSWNSPVYGSQTSTPDHDSVLKVAVAVKKDDFGVNFFGGTTYTDTSGDINVDMTQLTIGNHRGGTAPLQGHIRQFKYYPKRLPNAQLQGLTQQ